MKNKIKRAWQRALALLLIIAIELGTVNIPTVYAQADSAAANQTATEFEEWDQITTTQTFEGKNCRVTFTLTSYWDTGYNANIKVENTGITTIQNWYLAFEHENAITNIWNAEISKHDGTNYVVKNAGWNQDIAAGGSVEFGISSDHALKSFPKNYELVGTSEEVSKGDYAIDYHVWSDWGSGFSGVISITNNTNATLEDWVLEFNFDREITEIWNGIIEEHEGNRYVIRNATYNSAIAPSGTVSIGMNGSGGKIDDEPFHYNLYSYNGIKKNENPEIPEIDIEKDTDHDGAPDYMEEYFGTDINRADTDGDGLSDYIEIYSLVLDPLRPDTDDNRVADGDEDYDKDGLSNLYEIEIGTSMFLPDTDEDGLSDADEIQLYGTDPLLKDTDSDGVSDAREIELGTNPLVYESNFALTVNAEDADTVKVSVEMELPGEQVESLTVQRYESDFLFPTDMPGYIGGAYDFSVDGSFDKATIRFEFDEALLADPDFDPVIYYFNETEQLLEELETQLDGNVASAEVTHFSKYILINRCQYERAFEWQDVWTSGEYSGVEIVLVIDDSGSMYFNDSSNLRLAVARDLVDQLPNNSKVGVVKFESYIYRLTPTVTDDKELVKSYLTTKYFRSDGDTYMYEAINSAFSLFTSTDESTLKMMVVLSDGDSFDTHLHTSTIACANRENVKIYTVGLGRLSSSYFTQYLEPLAENTSGEFYFAQDAEQLNSIYKDINKKIDIETDSDGDGIPDYFEEHMVLFNGKTIALDKNNPDSDGDGIPDGEEVIDFNYRYNSDKTLVLLSANMASDPLDEDTDHDGLPDEEEYIIGTDPKVMDTDKDGLTDGFEYIHGYDPLEADIDKDGLTDKQEYLAGTNPYLYNKKWLDYTWEFMCGFVAGDFIRNTDSLATVMGQIVGSLIPGIDIRDVVANLVYGDYMMAGLSAVGLIPAAGDLTKAAGKVGKFFVKNIDNIPKIAGVMEFLSKNFPDVLKALGKNQDFIKGAQQLSEAKNLRLTRHDMKVISAAFETAGQSSLLLKTSNSLELKGVLDVSADVWEKKWSPRGYELHDSVVKAYHRKDLGKTFPIVDSLENRVLISTKTLDVAAPSYQNPSVLKSRLNSYMRPLDNVEKKFFIKNNEYKYNGRILKKSDYDTKALEIILPDVIIKEDTLKVLNEFKETWEEQGVEVWYRTTR